MTYFELETNDTYQINKLTGVGCLALKHRAADLLFENRDPYARITLCNKALLASMHH